MKSVQQNFTHFLCLKMSIPCINSINRHKWTSQRYRVRFLQSPCGSAAATGGRDRLFTVQVAIGTCTLCAGPCSELPWPRPAVRLPAALCPFPALAVDPRWTCCHPAVTRPSRRGVKFKLQGRRPSPPGPGRRCNLSAGSHIPTESARPESLCVPGPGLRVTRSVHGFLGHQDS